MRRGPPAGRGRTPQARSEKMEAAGDSALLSALTDMGFESAAAAAALRATGSRNVEAAVLWLCGSDGAGDAAAQGEPATGVPAASAYAVVHPDGTPAPAWVARVDGDFKARASASVSHVAAELKPQTHAGGAVRRR